MPEKKTSQFDKGQLPASKSIISLSQALLAPLDAILKSQVHAARSFLNLVLQMGYPHVEDDKEEKPNEQEEKKLKMYMQEFRFETTDAEGKSRISKISIPALALVPITPLAVESANFDLEFSVSHMDKHTQVQSSRKAKTDKDNPENPLHDESSRPWYLVKEPISIRGTLASKSEGSNTQQSTIKINIKLAKQPLSAGLDKLLTTLNQLSKVSEEKTNQ